MRSTSPFDSKRRQASASVLKVDSKWIQMRSRPVLGRGIADDDRMDLRESPMSLPRAGGCTGVVKAKDSAQCMIFLSAKL